MSLLGYSIDEGNADFPTASLLWLKELESIGYIDLELSKRMSFRSMAGGMRSIFLHPNPH